MDTRNDEGNNPDPQDPSLVPAFDDFSAEENLNGKYIGLLAGNEIQREEMLSSEWKWKGPNALKDEKRNDDINNAAWEAENDDASSADLLDHMAGDTTVSADSIEDVSGETIPDNEMDLNDVYLNEGFSSSPLHSSDDKSTGESEDNNQEQPLIKVTDCDILESGRQSPANHQRRSGCYERIPEGDTADAIVSIKIEEITPSKRLHPTIANKLTIADEYFLSSSLHSIPTTDKNDMRSNTMQNIHERSSFLNLTSDVRIGKAMHRALLYLKDEKAFSSMVAINTQAMKDLERDNLISDVSHKPVVKSQNYTKNVFMISLCVLLNFVALGSVRNLQSSINHEGGIGVLSMAVSFLGYMFASTFSSCLVQSIQPHYIFIAHLVPHLLYVASNNYPAPWLLAPVSFFQGMALAIGWNAMSTYMTLLAAGEAKLKDKDYSVVSGHFFGIFGLFFQSYFIVGNLIASLVLTYASSPPPDSESDHNITASGNKDNIYLNSSNILLDNATDEDYMHLCGANYWQHYDMGGAALYVSDETKFLLYGVYMACVAVAILICIFQIEPINLEYFNRTVGFWDRLKKHLWSLAKLWVNPKFLLLVPLQMFSFMEVGFATAEVTKAFVTCPIGIHMVGWTMMFLGICGSISSYFGGVLTKCIGRASQIIFAVAVDVVVLIFMANWQPTDDSYLPYFAMLGLWGVSDGLWVAHINSLMNTVFPTKYEEAFSGLRMCQGIGVAIVFGYSNSLGMLSKIYITGIFSIVAVIMYMIHVFIFKPEVQEKKEVELVRQTSV